MLILIAMEQEAQMFIDAFGLKEEKAKKPPLSNIPSRQFHRFYTPSPDVGEGGGDGQGVHVYVVTNGRDERFDCNNVGCLPVFCMRMRAVTIRPHHCPLHTPTCRSAPHPLPSARLPPCRS